VECIGPAREEAFPSNERSRKNLLAAAFEQRDPDLNKGSALVQLFHCKVELRGNTRLALVISVAAVFFVLLISCANAASPYAGVVSHSRDRAMASIALGAGESISFALLV